MYSRLNPAVAVMSARQAYHYIDSLRTYGLPRNELEQLQLRRMRAILRYADRNVAQCHETFGRVGFDPEKVQKADDLRKLPALSKPEILKLHQEALASGRAKGARLLTTSGTTSGQPSVLAVSKRGRAVNRALSLRKKTKWGLRPWSRVATLWAPERFWRQEMTAGGAFRPITGVYRFPLGLRPPNLLTLWVDPSDPVKDGKTLAAFKPDFIYSRPSYLRRIARFSGAGLGLRPKAIFPTGEIMTDACFGELRDAFGARILRNYGAVGFGGLGFDCRYETGLHTNEDYKYYEVLKDGEQVSEGEVGELVVTLLYPELVPVLRFRTGDYVRLGPEERCECGSSTRRLIGVEGRENDWIVGRDGSKSLALEVANHIEADFGLRDFRLIQRSLVVFTLLLGRSDPDDDVRISAVERYLDDLTGSKVSLDVRPRTEEDYWLKTRPVVSEVESQEPRRTE